jgi:DNA invertase Pin-like site-specific DNA recombinase
MDTNDRAVALVRVSEVGSRKEGVDLHSDVTQFKKIRRECDAAGWTLARDEPFREMNISGHRPLEERPGLLAAVEMVERGEAHIIVTAFFDRAWRNLMTQNETIERVDRAGGKLFAVGHGFVSHATADDWRRATLNGFMAEDFYRVTKEKSALGQREAVLELKRSPRATATGFTRDADKRLRKNDEAPIVLDAFKLRASGATIKEVQAFLRQHGIHKSFNGTRSLLTQTDYTGDIHWSFDGEPVVVRDAHDQIVPRDLFNDVQGMSQPRGRRPKSEELLARQGVLVCGTCGTPMTTGTTAGRYRFYRCPPTGDCTRRVTISGRVADEVVWQKARAEALNFPGRADAAAEARAASAEADELEAVYGNLIDALTGREHVGRAKAKLDAAQAAAEAARARARRLESASAALVVDVNDPRLTLADRRGVIRRTIKRAIVAPASAGTRPAERVTFEGFDE